jgi:phage shock protein E
MKKLIVAVLILAVLVGGFFLISKPSDTSTQTASTKSEPITSFTQVQSAVSNGAVLLDVRTPEEYAAGHIKGATNFPLQDLQSGKYPDVSKGQKVFVYCHSGNRSSQSAVILKGAGYTDVVDLGAITHVEQIGGQIVTGS